MKKYLTKQQLENLSKYRYNSIDNSLLSNHVLNHFWNYTVLLFPKTIAPNLITFIGLMFTICNFCLLVFYDMDLYGKCPSWLYVSFGLGLFIYQTLDSIDGKQARRTNTSSPLGELFDHGCDSLNTFLLTLLANSTIRTGCGFLGIISVFTAFVNFYLTTLEEYYTGVLYLSFFSGPVEGIIILCLMFVFTGYTGPSFWQQTVPLINIQYNTCFTWIGAVGVLYNIRQSVRNMKKAKAQTVLYDLIPFGTWVVMNIAYYCLIYEGHHSSVFLWFTVFSGFSFSYEVSLVILAHVTCSKLQRFNFLYTVYVLAAINTQLQLISNRAFLYLATAVSAANYIYFAASVVDQFCDHLKINCFTIRSKKQ